jgi:hypothetical protein
MKNAKRKVVKEGYDPKKSLETRAAADKIAGFGSLAGGYSPKTSIETRTISATKQKTKTTTKHKE